MTDKNSKYDFEHLQHLLLDSIQDYAIFMLEPDGSVATWNEGAKRITQFTADEVLGKSYSSFFTQEAKDAKVPARNLATARSQGRHEEEGWRLRKDGSLFWASVVITPIHDNGKLVGFAKVTRDLTERKVAAERHAEQVALVAKLKEREDLIATLTHDMKNPLIGANRLLELMQSNQVRRSTLNSLQCLELLRGSIRETLSLTRNVIDILRLDITESLSISPENIDLKALVSEAVDIYQTFAAMRETRLTVDLPHEELEICADADAIKRILQNLLSNAVKFAPIQGNVHVRVANDGRKVTIEIEDDGPGVKDDELNFLFKPFSQAPLGTRYSGGNGLGLYTCKRLIEANNGHIEYVAEEAKGAKFRIEIPTDQMTNSSAA